MRSLICGCSADLLDLGDGMEENHLPSAAPPAVKETQKGQRGILFELPPDFLRVSNLFVFIGWLLRKERMK